MRTESTEVLLVEHTPAQPEGLAKLLRDNGYLATLAQSAEEGLELLRSRHFGIVVTDYQLPGQTGAWMLREARDAGRLRETGVLIVTSHPNPERTEGWKVLARPLDIPVFLKELAVAASGHAEGLEVGTPKSAPSSSPSPWLILIVDENEDIRASIAQALEQKGFSSVLMAEETAALDWMRRGLRPDVILLDLSRSPSNDASFREQQASDPALCDIPVILMIAEQSVDERFVGKWVLRKPFGREDLLSLLDLVTSQVARR